MNEDDDIGRCYGCGRWHELQPQVDRSRCSRCRPATTAPAVHDNMALPIALVLFGAVLLFLLCSPPLVN